MIGIQSVTKKYLLLLIAIVNNPKNDAYARCDGQLSGRLVEG